MADVSKVRSAYAFFQGKRQPVGGEKTPVTVAATVPIKPQPPAAPAQPQPAVPGMGKDQFAGVTQIVAELERRIGELEAALKAARAQTGTVATPPINPVPANQVPATTPIADDINKGIAQATTEIDKFNVELNEGIGKVNREVARVTGQINQVNQALQTQIPAISGQINQTVNAFKGLIDSFKGIKF
ncbi:MAG: hypothetical protein ACK46X_19860 [Candidatus Sericytochromatia bacterium]